MSQYVKRTEQIISQDGFFSKVHEHVAIYLKRCPFCGGKARHGIYNDTEDYLDHDYIYCEVCGNRSAYTDSTEQAADLWNARKTSHSPDSNPVKKCPFCGGKPQLDYFTPDEDDEAYVEPDDEHDEPQELVIVSCSDCEAATKNCLNPKDAIALWNARP